MIGIMTSVTIMKFILMLYRRKFKNEIVRAYAQDHSFDVMTNSMGLAAALLALRFYWCWSNNAIKLIATVRAYTFGSQYFVEVDIILPGNMLLSQAHAIDETLQEKLEQLPEVERAFVHVDFEQSRSPEHKPNV